MNKAATSTPTSTPNCFHCGSPLIFVSKKTVQLENSFSPVTTTIYRCSNQECQDDIDKKTAERKKRAEEQEEARQKRASLKKR